MKNVSQFLAEVRVELSRVQWPSSKEFTGSFIVVLGVIVVFALYLGLVDAACSTLVKKIFTYST